MLLVVYPLVLEAFLVDGFVAFPGGGKSVSVRNIIVQECCWKLDLYICPLVLWYPLLSSLLKRKLLSCVKKASSWGNLYAYLHIFWRLLLLDHAVLSPIIGFQTWDEMCMDKMFLSYVQNDNSFFFSPVRFEKLFNPTTDPSTKLPTVCNCDLEDWALLVQTTTVWLISHWPVSHFCFPLAGAVTKWSQSKAAAYFLWHISGQQTYIKHQGEFVCICSEEDISAAIYGLD